MWILGLHHRKLWPKSSWQQGGTKNPDWSLGLRTDRKDCHHLKMDGRFIHPIQASQFDILEWYPRFMSCHQYFMEVAQHKEHVQMVTAFTNIRLPFEKRQLGQDTTPYAASSSSRPQTHNQTREAKTLLLPYIRRLVATGFDGPDILELFFGPHWVQGIGSFHEVERRNFLFACKSSNWLTVKSAYDMEDGQVLPFLRTLKDPTVREIDNANKSWSEWLALQDWLVGPLSPSEGEAGIKEEEM